jgi:hypothetical protein
VNVGPVLRADVQNCGLPVDVKAAAKQFRPTFASVGGESERKSAYWIHVKYN